MTIEKVYEKALKEEGFTIDTSQRQTVKLLADIQQQLVANTQKKYGIRSKISTFFSGDRSPISGLYLWGDVGRGKTWLVNLFYESLENVTKKRIHFHHFMADIHEQLSLMERQKNPLAMIAQKYSSRYRVICLDEFIVTNIADAMLLYGLLDGLFGNGVTLIATSNRAPDDLYKNGLQRERFLPAIELIKSHTSIHKLDGDIDHRLSLLESSSMYITSDNTEDVTDYFSQQFEKLATSEVRVGHSIEVNHRLINTVCYSDEIAWFTFDELCDAPRATPDYIEISRMCHTVFISEIPVMGEYLDDKARRFIYLIDQLYDRKVKVFISAAASPDQLYTGKMLEFAFKRTVSRIIEMRSEQYIALSHQLR